MTQYYLDNTKADTSKYIATDGDWWYEGKVGLKQGSAFIKFVYSKYPRVTLKLQALSNQPQKQFKAMSEWL